MFGKIDPKQMASMMKQMGIKADEIDAARVVIEKSDGSKIVVENPQVQAIDMRGQKSFQVSGDSHDEAAGEGALSKGEKSDAEIIMEECNCTLQEAEAALEKTKGDLAEAILSLKGD